MLVWGGYIVCWLLVVVVVAAVVFFIVVATFLDICVSDSIAKHSLQLQW